MSSTVHLLVNPGAGRGKASNSATVVREALAAEGAEVIDVTGADADASLRAAHQVVAAGSSRLVVVGGDGLVHLAIQAVARTETVLGIVPVGTGNDFAAALGLSEDPVVAARAALAEPTGLDAIQAGHHWIGSVATVGFSADVNARANQMRFPRGPSRYTIATIRELPRLRRRQVTITVDGVPHEFTTAMIAVGNTRSFGGGMQICPAADPSDGLLDVTVVADLGRLELLRFFRLVFDGRHLNHRKVHTLRGAEIALEGDALDLWGDGEPVAAKPLVLKAVEGALRIAR